MQFQSILQGNGVKFHTLYLPNLHHLDSVLCEFRGCNFSYSERIYFVPKLGNCVKHNCHYHQVGRLQQRLPSDASSYNIDSTEDVSCRGDILAGSLVSISISMFTSIIYVQTNLQFKKPKRLALYIYRFFGYFYSKNKESMQFRIENKEVTDKTMNSFTRTYTYKCRKKILTKLPAIFS